MLNLCNGVVPAYVIPMIYKLAQKKHLHVTVGITNDVRSRTNDDYLVAIEELIAKVTPKSKSETHAHDAADSASDTASASSAALSNVSIVYLPFASTMYIELRNEVMKTHNPDIMVCGYTDAVSTGAVAVAGSNTGSARNRTRNGSISEMLNVVIANVSEEEQKRDSIEMTSFRRSMGVNNGTNLDHSELGYVGQAFYSYNQENCLVVPKLQSILVVHAPVIAKGTALEV